MTKQHTLAVNIGAALKGNFSSTISKGQSQITQLGSAIKKLGDDSKRIDSFRALKTQTESAKVAWKSAEDQVQKLSQQIRNTANLTQAMQREFEKAKNAATRSKNAYLKKRDSLQKVRTEMARTGQSTVSLTAQQTKLGASITKLQNKYSALDRTLRNQEAIKARRADLRGQVFDMIALGAAIGAPVKAAIDFESAMADAKKVMALPDDKNRADKVIKDLEKSLKQMSRTIPISAEGLATIAAKGAQFSVGQEIDKTTGEVITNVQVLSEFVETAAKMATAFELTEEEAGESIAKLSNILGIPIANMDKLGDAINHLSDNTAAKAQEIVKAMMRVGTLSKSFGLDPTAIAALSDSFIALGKAPEEAGTAINRMLTRLSAVEDQSPKFQGALAKMGLNATDLKDAIRNDAEGALLSFLETLSEVDAQDRAGIIFNLFGQQQVGSISALAGQLDVFKKALFAVKAEDSRGNLKFLGSMEREFKNRSATTANQMRLFTNTLEVLGVNMGTTLLPAINSVLQSFGTVVIGVADLTEKFPLATKVIFGTIFGLVALKIASLGAAFAWTFVTGGINLLRIGLAKLGVEVALTGIKFQAFNLVALKTIIRTKALAVATFISGSWRGLGLAAIFAKLQFKSFNLISAITLVRMKLLAIGQAVAGAFAVLGSTIALASVKMTAFNAISLVTTSGLKALAFGGLIKAFAAGLISLATGAIPIVVGGLKVLTVAFMTNPIGLIIGGIALAAGFLIAKWDTVKSFFSGMWEPVQAAWQVFAGWLGGFWKIISSPVTAIGELFGLLFGSNNEIQANVNTNETIGTNGVAENSALPFKAAGLQESIAGGVISNQRSVDSRTFNQTFNIEVSASPGQNEEAIAEKVMRQIKEISRGALFDTAEATL